MDNKINFSDDLGFDLKKLFLRYFSFWPIFLISFIFSISVSYIFLRYAEYQYSTSAVIEVIDKAQDSEMALPTSMTVFNRSMINLENEYGRLKSYNLNEKVVSKLKSNIRFFSIGKIKNSEESTNSFFPDYEFESKILVDTITVPIKFKIIFSEKRMTVNEFGIDDELIKTYNFDSFSTLNSKHNLPFELTVNKISEYDLSRGDIEKTIIFDPFTQTVEKFISLINLSQYGNTSFNSGSDQILINILYGNQEIAEAYVNELISSFDLDGIYERQLEYKNTIDFVDARSGFLQKEVDLLETRKQKFKQTNKLTDLNVDASMTMTKQVDYDSELFKFNSQKDLIGLLDQELAENKFNLLPSNFGLENISLNNLIDQYNTILKERNRLISYGAGKMNPNVINLERQIQEFYSNIKNSIVKYKQNLSASIEMLKEKESEFENFYINIPEKEKILREIERELTVKEALYSLLLQKKEEAAINFAVVKPSIKVIDSPRTSRKPVSPSKRNSYLLSIIMSIFIPFTILTLFFYFDNKIHIKDDLKSLNIPVLAEIPHIDDKDFKPLHEISESSRKPLEESIRMLIANLNYTLSTKSSNSILVTSSIKSEGKTLISTHLSKILSFSGKQVLLIGADLRNPQIHKFTTYEKSEKGLSNYIFDNSLDWKDLIKKNGKLDILLSGTIPPNPTELLASSRFLNLIKDAEKIYDYVIIDSAPCLLVADTLQFSKNIDTSVVITRADHSTRDVVSFIDELNNSGKLNSLNLVLNGVGKSHRYGYRYGYQYGYKYGYNYGYGYGYGKD